MNDLKKFKHVLLPLGIILLCFYGVNTYMSKVNAQKKKYKREISQIEGVISLNKKLNKAKKANVTANKALLESDQDTFLTDVLGYANRNGMVILSSRKVESSGGRGRTRQTRGTDSIIKEYAISLDFVANFEQVKGFLAQIESIQRYVRVTRIDMQELPYGSDARSRYSDAKLRGTVVVKAKAMEKIVL